MGREKLGIAKKNKNDEFYTTLETINKELISDEYRKQLKDKVIYCNCDDAKHSQFWRYFVMNYDRLELRGLITTYFPKDGEDKSYMLEINEEIIKGLMSKHKIDRLELFSKFQNVDEYYFPEKKEIFGDAKYKAGDFRSKDSIDLLKNKDVVVITKPPFSLFREYVSQLMKYKKKFLIIGSINAISYKEIFPLLKENKIWLGVSISSGDREFRVPNLEKLVRVPGVRWFTNLKHNKRNELLYTHKKYKGNELNYPKYHNYDAINIDKTKDIPVDYFGIMGVPISFMDKYNSKQFEIVALGITGNCEFLNNYKSEIYKDGIATGKFTMNCKGCVYYKWDKEVNKDIKPKYRNVENNDFYIAPYSRVLIKRIK